ncbi:MAG: VWA domain-containing protein [Ignavibacteria bacterium]|nr:VWA domain-containing protein [Ignavibacteria bacterium]
MKRFFVLIFLAVSFLAHAKEGNNFVFMFDNSGSMSGYYRESNSAFKLFAKALMKNSLKSGDNASVMLFTKSDALRKIESPKTIFTGPASNFNADGVIKDFNLMRGNDGDFGTTDLIEALDKGIASLDGNTGIIWLITDNINDNSGSGDSSYQNTLAFYQRLRSDVNIKKIMLFPIPEKVTEAGYSSNGYVAYAIVYSKENFTQLHYEVFDKQIRDVGIKQKAITLKPQDIGTIVLQPRVATGRITEGKLFFDGKTLRGFGFEEGEKVRETFNDLSLKSNLYPYIIKSANLNVHLDDFKSSDYSVKSLGTQQITPSTVSNVSPEGEVTGFNLIFNLPEITPTFSFNTIFKEDFSIGGNLVLEVSQTDIALDQNYINSFKDLFALQSIPEIFQPSLKDKKIVTTIPLEIKMKYGPWRLFVLIGLISLVVLILVFFVIMIMKKKCFTLVIDNRDEQDICLSAFSSYNVSYNYSLNLGVLKKSLFGRIKFVYSKFTTEPGRTVMMSDNLSIPVEYEDENFKKTSVQIMIKETAAKSESASYSDGDQGGIY